MKELTVEMVQDLNRIFNYVFAINDGKVVAMMTPEQEEQQRILMMVF